MNETNFHLINPSKLNRFSSVKLPSFSLARQRRIQFLVPHPSTVDLI